jgi:signal transduction histidine kinase
VPLARMRGSWDVTKVDQIVTNLLSNALKYGGGMSVDVKLFHSDGIALLDIRDYGIGVSPKDRDRIFQRFERAVSSSQYPGMGIGLWLSRETARAMGGNVELVVLEGPGSLFRLSLPLEHKRNRL